MSWPPYERLTRARIGRHHRVRRDAHEAVGVLLLGRLAIGSSWTTWTRGGPAVGRVDAHFEHIVLLDGFEPEPRVALTIEKREPND